MLVVTLAWRLPSLFDPPWVNDEGTYFAIAQAMTHGFRLYAGIWENKPPAIYLMYAAVYHLFGPSLIAVRLLATLSVALLVVLVYRIALRLAAPDLALASAMLTGLVMGVPFLEGTTANAEVFLTTLASLAVYLALIRNVPALAGIVMALAIAFKAVAAFDAVALGLWLLWHERGHVMAYVPALILSLGSVAAGAWWLGIFPAMVRDAFLYDLGYVGQGNGASLPWLLLIKAAFFALIVARQRHGPFVYLWLVFTVAGALTSGRIFGHYLLPAVAPLTLSLGVLLKGRTAWRSWPILLPVVFLFLGALAALVGWGLAAGGHDTIFARRLQYYANFIRYAAGTESRAAYRAQVDDHVNRNLRVVSELHRLSPGRLLVWGNTPWLYPLSGRLPATPYTSALRQPPVPGEKVALADAVRAGRPTVVVVIRPPRPPLDARTSGALRRRYGLAATIGVAAVFVRGR